MEMAYHSTHIYDRIGLYNEFFSVSIIEVILYTAAFILVFNVKVSVWIFI